MEGSSTTPVVPSSSSSGVRRKVLGATVAALVAEVGFESVERAALETLAEMLQSTLVEAGRSSRAYCELSGRTQPLVGDAVLALLEMGLWNGPELEVYAKRPGRPVPPAPAPAAPPKQPSTLAAGERQQHPSHVPDHLPPFPDPHAYIRTPTHKQPVTEYEAIREKAAAQKRDVERALTRFVAKTGPTHSLFLTHDLNLFPLVACRSTPAPYLQGLLPKDQVFDEEEEAPPVRRSVKREAAPPSSLGPLPSGEEPSVAGGGSERENALDNGGSDSEPTQDARERAVAAAAAAAQEVLQPMDPDFIDNPYLRSVKMPRLNKKKPL